MISPSDSSGFDEPPPKSVVDRGVAPPRGIIVAGALLGVAVVLVVIALALEGPAAREVSSAACVAIALAFAIGVSSVRQLLRPLRDLRRAARRIADGDLGVHVPAVDADEIAKLGRAINDLTSRLVRAIRDHRVERDRLNGILDGMREGVLVVDRDRQIVLANAAIRLLTLGATSETGPDLVGRPVLEVVRNAALLEAIDRSIARPSEEHTDAAELEIELTGVVPRKLLVRVTRHSAGESIIAIAVFHDVTNLRRLETIRTDFVANVSHELRTPITAISTAAETLLGGALDDPEGRVEFATMIQRQALRLRQLVDDLLDLSKLEAKGARINLAPEPVAKVVDQVVRLAKSAADAKGTTITVKHQGNESALADRRALEQVLTNLVDNAIKYAGRGAKVDVSVRERDDTIEIAIKDNGPGIPKAHIGRIFERFYRVDPGRSKELGGTGLGLAIVKHLIELMNGEVAVDSQVGRGALFTVRLPNAAIAPKAATPAPATPSTPD